MGATPTPWEVERVLDPGDLSRPWIGRIEESRFAALVCGDTREEAFANANLIVTAVNNHAALVKYLSIFLGHDDRFQVAVGGNPNAIEEMLNGARAALSAASASETGKEG